MKLTAVTPRNFRGFSRAFPMDLDAQVVLFYGPNGRGKSTVFSALELGLFPRETLAELQREMGDRAPLTNLFYQGEDSEVGAIQVTLRGDGGDEVTINQEVRQETYRIAFHQWDVLRGLEGRRSRLFYTQRLLRDLMFGTPERRHGRVKQLLGSDGYDDLMPALYDWLRDMDYQITQLEDQAKALAGLDRESLLQRFRAAFPGLPVEKVMGPGGLTRSGPDMVRKLIREHVSALYGQTPLLLAGKVSSFADLAARLERVCLEVLGDYNAKTALLRQLEAEETWTSRRLSLLERMPANRDLSDELNALSVALVVLETALPTELVISNPNLTYVWLRQNMEPVRLAIGRDHPIWSQIETFEADVATLLQRLRDHCRVGESLQHFLTGWSAGARSLAYLSPVLRLLKAGHFSGTEEARTRLLYRKRFSTFIRLLYRSIAELVDEQMQQRIALVRDRWNMFYRSMATFSHFQELDLEVVRVSNTNEPWTVPPDRWSFARFRVRDAALGASTLPFAMETVLSEGQLNCAIVALALALAGAENDVGQLPIQVLALDDPFVSWDDVNMENFMLAVRHLADSGTQVLLSSCDMRVVHSVRRNMETLHVPRPALIYSFTGWDRIAGPTVDKQVVKPREPAFRYLSELPVGQFRGRTLTLDHIDGMQVTDPQPDVRRTEPQALYYILTTTLPACRQALLDQHRFDHLYRGQPDTRPLLERTVREDQGFRTDAYFVYYDRVEGSPTYHQLCGVYRLVKTEQDTDSGKTSRGHDKYSLFLEPIGQVGRPFIPGTGLWESLSATRGRRLGDFFRLNGRVLIPISAADYHEVLGLR